MSKASPMAAIGGLLLVIAVALAGFALYRTYQKEPVLKAERLEITDSTGASRVIINTLEGDRPSITLLDPVGEARAWLFLSRDGAPNFVMQDGPRLILADKEGEIRVLQRLEADGAPTVSFADATGRVRALQWLDASGSPAIELYDADGNPMWTTKELPVLP